MPVHVHVHLNVHATRLSNPRNFCGIAADEARMPLDHERLHVYQVALDFLVLATNIIDAALLDVLVRLQFVEGERHQSGKAMLERIVAMLVKLVRNCE